MDFRQQGGLLINNKNKRDAFLQFLYNSKIRILARGSFGITFVATISPDKVAQYSQYVHSDATLYGQPVNSILFKLSIVYDEEAGEDDVRIKYVFKNKDVKIHAISIPSFENEVNNQTEIFLMSTKYLQAYCPAIVYAEIGKLGKSDILDILYYIQNNLYVDTEIEEDKNGVEYNAYDDAVGAIRTIIESGETGEFSKIGIIAMQYMDEDEGFDKLGDVTTDYSYDSNSEMISGQPEDKIKDDMQTVSYYLSVYYLLIKLAVDTGYTHGDFHRSNILFREDPTYFSGVDGNEYKFGRPMIIDFGLSFKMSKEQYNIVKGFYKNRKYSSIIKYLCLIGRADGKPSLTTRNIYRWACKSPLYADLDAIFSILEKGRKVSQRGVVEMFKSLRNQYGEKAYPKLPLFRKNWRANPLLPRLFQGMGREEINEPEAESVGSMTPVMTPPLNGSIAQQPRSGVLTPIGIESGVYGSLVNMQKEQTRKKCPRGYRYSKNTKKCEGLTDEQKKVAHNLQLLKTLPYGMANLGTEKRKCPKGTRKNKISGACEQIGNYGMTIKRI